MNTRATPRPAQNQRLLAAGAVVVVVIVAIWLFGRPDPPEPTVEVVATAVDWPAKREAGEFITVEMPADTASLFVTPAELEGRVPAIPVPAGAVVSEAMLADAGSAFAADLSSTLLALTVDPSLWPDPGPRAGDIAVLAEKPGGCAAAVLPVVLATDETLVVEARPQAAAVLGPVVWWTWESPVAGWPACAPAAAGTEGLDGLDPLTQQGGPANADGLG